MINRKLYYIISNRTSNYKIKNIFVKDKRYKIGISLDDTISNKPIIELAMNNSIKDKVYLIGEFIWK